ncbi:MAG: response regulator transcription factor, partial [Chloroflexi bacterium]|nr:response regulator transcription factor [Chloroflexota bacterium]
LILTAKDEEIDKVLGLELGADDYMTKPFSMRELMARVRALLRRVQMHQAVSGKPETETQVLQVRDLALDVARHEVKVGGNPVSLRPKEFDLLQYLMVNRGQVLTREMILERVWGYEYAGDTRTVDVHVRWLREKIEGDPGTPQYVHTVRNVGYKFGE